MKKLIIAFILLLGFGRAEAQLGWEAGGWAGISYYFGDLNTSFDLGRPGFMAGIGARRNFNNRLCLKLAANYGQVSGDDARSNNAFERRRNLSFRSDIADVSATFEFNFFPYNHGSKQEWFTPYLFAGINAFRFNPKALYNDQWYELRPLGTEGQFQGSEYYSILGGIAYGGGIKMDLNYFWSLNVEISSRLLFTDYLDDVSGSYADKDDLGKLRGDVAVALSDRSLDIDGEGQIGRIGFQRGNIKNNDVYTFVNVGIMYFFGDLHCPSFK